MTQLIDLGKLRFHFAGDWSQSTTYETNDIVKYGGNVYVYTYALKTSGQVPTNSTYWALMVEGFKFKGVYDPTVAYRIGDGVAHGGKVYVCVLDNTNQTPPNDTYWSQFADGIQYEGTYSAVKAYQKNDVVVYGGSIYIAKVDTTGNLPTSATYWDRFVEGVSAKGVYNSSTAYVPGDLVAYGGSLYQAKADNTNVNPTTTATWNKLVSGFANRGVWTTATQYATDEVVTFGGNTYIALLPHASTVFETDLTASKWQKFNSGVRWTGDWATSTAYLKDDIVKYGVSTYIVTSTHTAGTFATDLAAGKLSEFAKGGDYVLPPAVGNTGRFLSSDGTGYAWGDVTAQGVNGPTAIDLVSGGTSTATYQAVFAGTSLAIKPSDIQYYLSSGAVTGLRLDPATGVLTISDLADGSYTATVTAVAKNQSVSKTVTVRVAANVPVFSTALMPDNFATASAFTTSAAQATSASGTVTHTLASGTLPSWATLNADGTITGTSPATLETQPYVFTVKATANGYTAFKTYVWRQRQAVGQQLYGGGANGVYSWVCPPGVTSVSAVCVGGGGGGSYSWSSAAGGGAGLGWKNDIPVTPGQTYTVVVGVRGYPNSNGGRGGDSYFISDALVAGGGGGCEATSSYYVDTKYGNNIGNSGGGWRGDGGGAGGRASSYNGGGGAGGYTGNGGNGYDAYGAAADSGGANGGGYHSSTYGTGAGGGVGLNGKGATGYRNYTPWSGYSTSMGYGGGGEGGSGGTDGYYGQNQWSSNNQSGGNQGINGGMYGGGGGGPGTSYGGGYGGYGGVRLIWGPGRAFPATNTADQTTLSL